MAYFEHELVVDNFAGGGGASTGIEWGLGRPVDLAFNHCRKALGMHSINHPFTEHFITDVFDVEPALVTKGKRVGFGHFSPDCTDHSKAKGKKPVRKRIRALCLVMLRWADIRTRVMTMENVEEIQDWGPLVQVWNDGVQEWHRDPQHKGRCWKAFLNCLGSGIDPAHPDLPEFLTVLCGDEDEDTAQRELILQKKEVWREKLVKGFGYECEQREIRGYSHGARTIRNRLFMVCRCDGRPIVWPAASHERPEKLKAEQLRWRTVAEILDFSLPCPSIFLTRKQAKKWKCRRPLATNTLQRIATGVGKFVIHAAEPFIVNLTHAGAERVQPSVAPFVTEHANSSNQRNMPADEPMRTACAGVKGGHFALVGANLVHTAHGERDKSGKKRGRGERDVQEPLPTITASPDCALVATNLVKMRGRNTGNAVDEPMRTASAGGQHHGLVATSLVRHFGESVGQEVDAPCPTITAGGGGKTGLLAVHMAQHNGGFNTVDGRPVDEPVSAITASGSQQQLVATSMAAYYKSESDGQRTDEPLRTTTTKARLCHVESRAVHPLTASQLAGARRVAVFLRKYGVKFEGEFAMVRGHVIVDIGMRMLTPRELYRAQGFEDDYIIDRAWVVDAVTGLTHEVKLTKEEQIRFVGNSVCPHVMAALARANVPELIMPHPPTKWRPSLALMKAAKLVA